MIQVRVDKLFFRNQNLEIANYLGRLALAMSAKTQEMEDEFRRRFPRDNYRSSGSVRRITHNLPKPLLLATSDEPLSDRQKIDELMFAMDEDSDGAADPWELHNWMVKFFCFPKTNFTLIQSH